MLSAARRFWRGSAAGPSGLRGDHLRAGLGTPHCDEVAAHLGDVVRLLASGAAPPELARHLAGAALFTLRRLVGIVPGLQGGSQVPPVAPAGRGRCSSGQRRSRPCCPELAPSTTEFVFGCRLEGRLPTCV